MAAGTTRGMARARAAVGPLCGLAVAASGAARERNGAAAGAHASLRGESMLGCVRDGWTAPRHDACEAAVGPLCGLAVKAASGAAREHNGPAAAAHASLAANPCGAAGGTDGRRRGVTRARRQWDRCADWP